MRWKWAIYTLPMLLFLIVPGVASAHGAKIDYTTTMAMVVKIHAAFDTGEPMANAQVVIYTPADPVTPWQTGVCDEQGNFSFMPDTSIAGTWEVQVRQAGHGDTIYINVEDSAGTTDGLDAEGEGAATASSNTARAVQATSGSSNNFTTLQYVIMSLSVAWGLVGTALFFSNRRRGI